MFFYDPRYMLFMAPAFIIMLLVQFYVSSAYNKWSKVPSRIRLSGAEAAQKTDPFWRIVRRAGRTYSR